MKVSVAVGNTELVEVLVAVGNTELVDVLVAVGNSVFIEVLVAVAPPHKFTLPTPAPASTSVLTCDAAVMYERWTYGGLNVQLDVVGLLPVQFWYMFELSAPPDEFLRSQYPGRVEFAVSIGSSESSK